MHREERQWVRKTKEGEGSRKRKGGRMERAQEDDRLGIRKRGKIKCGDKKRGNGE